MKKKLNDGEREEYLIKIYLCYLRDSKIDLPKIGKIIPSPLISIIMCSWVPSLRSKLEPLFYFPKFL